MAEQSLLQELEKHKVDFETEPASYYSGGLEDPCRIEPDNIIAFFSNRKRSPKNEKLCHHRYQLKCNLGKPAFMGLEDLKFQIPTNSGMVIFPFQIHYFDLNVPRDSRFYLTITFTDRGNGRESLLPLMNHPFQIDPEDFPLLRTIVCAYQKLEGYHPEDAVHALRLFLNRKLRQTGSAAPVVSFDSPFMNEVLKLVRENFNKPPRIKDLAQMLHISESHLRLKIRRQFNGISLGKFLHHLQFYHACELIGHTDLPIREIALKCGYSDIYSFSRAFKNYTGFSPSGFRKQNRKS